MGKYERVGKRKLRSEKMSTRCPKLGYYLIVTDTEATEKNYFEGLRNSIPGNIKNNIVMKVIKTSTNNLVNICLDAAAEEMQYRELWIVFDRDQVKDFDGIIDRAKREDIHVGWSNPCIEIWFYAYFGRMPSFEESVECCNEFSDIFKKKVGIEYKKSRKDIYGKLCQYGDEEKAFTVAKKRRTICKQDGKVKPSAQWPATTVDILIEEIKNKINC